jgi:hypothetical protein
MPSRYGRYSRKELNVSFMREKRLKLAAEVDNIKHKVEGKILPFYCIVPILLGKIKQVETKSQQILHQWGEKSQELISDFLEFWNQGNLYNRVKQVMLWLYVLDLMF